MLLCFALSFLNYFMLNSTNRFHCGISCPSLSNSTLIQILPTECCIHFKNHCLGLLFINPFWHRWGEEGGEHVIPLCFMDKVLSISWTFIKTFQTFLVVKANNNFDTVSSLSRLLPLVALKMSIFFHLLKSHTKEF